MELRLKDMLIEMRFGTIQFHDSTAQLLVFQVICLPSSHIPVQVLSSGHERLFIVDQEGMVWQVGEDLLEPIERPRGVSVRQVACGGDVILLVTVEGVVYVKGTDSEGSGVMGGIEATREFVKMQSLADVSITQVAMSTAHCAALDSNFHIVTGQLWTWGSGPQLGRSNPSRLLPAPVPSARVFTGKKLICSQKLTGLITTGGFLYLYGEIGGHEGMVRQSLRSFREGVSANQTLKPIILPGLREKYVENAEAGATFLAVLTDTGEVYLSDACLDLVRLPVETGTKITALGLLNVGVYGWAASQSILYTWRQPETVESQTSNLSCVLSSWTGECYSPLFPFSLVSSADLCISTSQSLTPFQPFAAPLASLSPYHRSQFTSSLAHRVYGRAGRWNELQDSSPLLPCQAGLIRLTDAMQRCWKRDGLLALKHCPSHINKPQYVQFMHKLTTLQSRIGDTIRRKYLHRWRFQPICLVFKTSGVNAIAFSLKHALLRRVFAYIQRYISLRLLQKAGLRTLLSQKSRLRRMIGTYIGRWRTQCVQLRLFKAGKEGVKALGIRVVAGLMRTLLRREVWRKVVAALQTADLRENRLKALMILLEMRVEKVQRRLYNWAFNRIYRMHSELYRIQQAFAPLQAVSGSRLQCVLRELCRVRENDHLLAKNVFALVWTCRRKYHRSLRIAWKAIRAKAQISEAWNSALSGGSSVGKASLKIPTLSLSASCVQSPLACKGHRVSESLRTLPPKLPRYIQTKPPWKRPSAAAPFDVKSPLFSPKARQTDYVQTLKHRTSKYKSPTNKSLQSSRCPSPDLVLFDSEWSGSNRYKPDSADTTDVSVQLSAESSKPASQDRSQDLEREWKLRALRAGLVRLQTTLQAATVRVCSREFLERVRLARLK
jgi:hypothetical protein